MRLFVVGLVCVALSACAELESLGGGLHQGKTGSSREALVTKVSLSTARVSIEAPYGYCVEPGSVKTGGTRGVAVFGNCAAISGSRDAAQPIAEALVTTSVARLPVAAAAALVDTKALETFLKSDDGRTALSRSGSAGSVQILDSFVTGKAVYIRLRDTSAQENKALAPEHWRAVFGLQNAGVSISVRGLNGGSLSPAEGLAIVRDFARRTKSELSTTAPAKAAATSGQTLDKGTLGRLFG